MDLVAARVVRLIVRFSDDAISESDCLDGPELFKVMVDVDVREADDVHYQVSLRIRCLPVKGDRRWRFERIEVEVQGRFEVVPELAEGPKSRMVGLNAPSILHGLARGLVASATGLCVGGPFIIPTVNFVAWWRRRLKTKRGDDREQEAQG